MKQRAVRLKTHALLTWLSRQSLTASLTYPNAPPAFGAPPGLDAGPVVTLTDFCRINHVRSVGRSP